ncbi:MAG: beta strand repeat-containing protein, partial [Flavobacteriales bacterium]
GNLIQSSTPSLFNNLPGAVLALNGWQSTTSSWSANLNNQGTVNKNNGAVQFTFLSNTVTNPGQLNINSGEFFANANTFTNTGAIAGNPGTTLRTGTTTFSHNSGAVITGVPTLIVSAGTCNLNTGSSVNTLDQLSITGGTLNCGIAVNTAAFTFSGGTLNGPQAVNVSTGGAFTWTGGIIGSSGILNLASGSTSTFNPGATTLFLSGTINNNGTWTMQSGNLAQSGTPSLFNNLSGAVIALNGWQSTTSSWSANLNNQGTVNKNNGAVQFGYTSGGFANLTGGVWNINSGTWSNATLATQSGAINIAAGATLTSSSTLNFSGTTITNNGSITTPSVVFLGTALQQLGGNGSINALTINNASGVGLVGDQQVNNTLTFTSGLINAPANALVLASAATVTGANASRYVNGAVRWNYPTGSGVQRVFPIGGATAFTPLTLNFASIGNGGTLTARSVDGDHPQVNTSLIAPNKSVNRHWALNNNG